MADAVVEASFLTGARGLVAFEPDFDRLAREFKPIASRRMEPVFKRELRRALGRRPKYPRKTNRGLPRTMGIASLFTRELSGTSTEEKTETIVTHRILGAAPGTAGEAGKLRGAILVEVGSRAHTRSSPAIPTVTLIERGRRGAGRISATGSFWGRDNRRVGYRPPRGFRHVAIPPRHFLKAVRDDAEMQKGLRSDFARAVRQVLEKGWIRPSSSTMKLTIRLRNEDVPRG